MNVKCKCADNATDDTADPIPIPSAGTNRSFWKTTRLKIGATPPTTNITNYKWYTDGTNSFGTGVTCNVAKASTTADAGYRQSTAAAPCGTQLNQTNHTGLDAAVADCFTKTSAAPLALAGTGTTANTETGDHVVYQMDVTTTASPGPTGSETFTFQYDET